MNGYEQDFDALLAGDTGGARQYGLEQKSDSSSRIQRDELNTELLDEDLALKLPTGKLEKKDFP